MPDITMCADGDVCPYKNTCYRYNAIPSAWQSYAMFYKCTYDKKLGICSSYWWNKGEGKKMKYACEKCNEVIHNRKGTYFIKVNDCAGLDGEEFILCKECYKQIKQVINFNTEIKPVERI